LLLVFMVAAVALGFEASAVTGLACLVLTLLVSLAYQAVEIMLRLRRVLPAGSRAYRPKEWVHGSLPFAVIYAFQHLSSFADVLVLSFFISPAEIAVYFAATRIIQVVNLVPYAATVGTAHLFSAAHTRGDHDDLQRLCGHVSLLTFAIAAVAVAVILVSGKWLLWMFGTGFEAGYLPLAILALGVVARVAAGPAEDILNMTGYSRLSASTYFWTVLANVVLAVALAMPFGINGVAAATAVALAARGFWLSLALRQQLGVEASVFAAAMAREGAWRARLRRPEAQSPAE
jgi:O-antigen/teichoic acid export membrane protein